MQSYGQSRRHQSALDTLSPAGEGPWAEADERDAAEQCLLRGWTPPPVGTLPEQRLRAAVGATSFVHTRVGQLPPGSAGRAPAWAARAAGEGRPARGASLLGCLGARPSPRADGQMSAACQGLAKEDGVTARTTAETLPSA